jgi:hypothetical protein
MHEGVSNRCRHAVSLFLDAPQNADDSVTDKLSDNDSTRVRTGHKKE